MQIKTELVLLPEEAANEQVWKAAALNKAGIHASEAKQITLTRRSIDARSKTVKVNLTVAIYTQDTTAGNDQFTPELQNVTNASPVVVIGCGPAGLFAALKLISLGIKPVIIERGKNVKDRRRDLATLNKQRIVNPDSNYCFGEGGAGTYSDGKLYTRSGKRGNIDRILNTFVHFGATSDICIDSHPHIGTNKLPAIIESMRNAILSCGGEILFNHRFTGIIKSGNHITGIKCKPTDTNQSEITISTTAAILATGHSAKDIYEYLSENKILIESKSFALGVRIEHPQSVIDQIQYHCKTRSEFLPPSSYALTTQANGRGVYSFCMCPGGIIAAAATSPGEVVVNGWSPSKRNNPFANSGMVVSVGEDDFKPFINHGELRAMRFQQQVETGCFDAGGKNLTAPGQRLMDFIENRNSSTLPSCSYTPGITPVHLKEVLPAEITKALKAGLVDFGKKMRGYLTNEAVLVATESRTSSPVRIPRDKDTLMHPEINGFFPCGEGAGYAGGIMSAAMDGERVAEAVASYIAFNV